MLWLPQDSAQVASFRQDVDGYTGAVDTRLRQNDPDTEFLTAATMFVDAVVSAGDPNPEQVLLRFDNIVGTGENQIPAGSRVEAAILDIPSVNPDAMGDGGLFYKLLQPWPDLATWNAWVDGIQTNGVEAAVSPSAVAGNAGLNPDVQGGFLSFDLTADVQSWVNGSANNGWMINPWPGGGNGWGLTTAENPIGRNRPRLRVFYTAGTGTPNEDIILQNPVLSAEGLNLRFQGLPSSSYDVEHAETLDGSWSKVGSATTDSSGAAIFTDTTANAQAGFYRVVRP